MPLQGVDGKTRSNFEDASDGRRRDMVIARSWSQRLVVATTIVLCAEAVSEGSE